MISILSYLKNIIYGQPAMNCPHCNKPRLKIRSGIYKCESCKIIFSDGRSITP